MSIAVNLTTNPLFLLLLVSAVIFVVIWRRTSSPWARNMRGYLLLGMIIIAVRLFFQTLIGIRRSGYVIMQLPELVLPSWAMGLQLGGPVTAEALLFSLYDSLRLATMLICLGAANALANPRRALRSVPAALYELSVVITIAVTVAPQLIESTQRVRRARRLRGGKASGWSALTAVIIPVLADAIDRCLELAASMESRGFGRTNKPDNNRGSAVVLLLGAIMSTLGIFALLGVAGGWCLAAIFLGLGLVCIVLGLLLGRRRLGVSRYRSEQWLLAEWLVVVCGIACAATAGILLGQNSTMLASQQLQWPELDLLMLLSAGCAVAPAFLTPVPPARALKL